MNAGRELDALVAEKILRLTPCPYFECGNFSAWGTIWGCQHSDGKGAYPVRWKSVCFPSNPEAINHPHSPLLRYSTNIAAAWQVVERWRASNRDGRMWLEEYDEPDGHGWRCWFGEACGFAETAPIAICLAALKAAGAEVPSCA